MKYLDADKLIAEINALKERYSSCVAKNETEKCYKSGRLIGYEDALYKIASLQQEQPELPPIGYAETYYQKGLHDGIIKGRMEILKGLEEIEKRKAEPVLVIKEQEQPEVDLEKEANECWNYVFSAIGWDENSLMLMNHKEFLAFARHFAEWGAEHLK